MINRLTKPRGPSEELSEQIEKIYTSQAKDVPRWGMFAVHWTMVENFSKTLLDDNSLIVLIYTLKALGALRFVLKGLDFETGMPDGNVRLVVKQRGFPSGKLYKRDNCYGQPGE
jgi:hypothetical protein